MSRVILRRGNDQIVTLSGLRATDTGVYLNDATVQATMLDSKGRVLPAFRDIPMMYVPDSDGAYEWVIEADTMFLSKSSVLARNYSCAGRHQLSYSACGVGGGRRDLMYARILARKFNPFHDKFGKFTSKQFAAPDSGGGGGAAPARMVDVSSWPEQNVKVGSHSNPGGVFKDPEGRLHYIKYPQRNPEQAQTEHLADAIYRELGIPVKESQLVMKGKTLGLAGRCSLAGKRSAKTRRTNRLM